MAKNSNYNSAPRKSHLKRNVGCVAAVIALSWGVDQRFNHGDITSFKNNGTASIGSVSQTPVPTKYVTQGSRPTTYQDSFNALARKIPGNVGLAYVPLGKGGKVQSYGKITTGPAWSTSKIPVAIAYETEVNDSPTGSGVADLKRAITESNNDAANALWANLGSNAIAAQKTQAVLRAGGDSNSIVPSQWSNRAGVATIFGQTEWSLADQARFVASLPCMPHADKVVSLMGQITAGQRWGIGATDAEVSSAFKDGWSSNGPGQLTRQMAIVHTPSGEDYALTMATTPTNENFATGQRNITALANWAVSTIHGVPKGTCD